MAFVGIDLGTQSIKAVVCSDRLDVLGAHAIAQTTRYPRPGWAEQDPPDWERALPDLHSAAQLAPAHSAAVLPQRSLDEPYARYRDLVMRLVTTTT